MIMIVLLSRVLEPLDIISKEMQPESTDITSVCVLLESLLEDLSDLGDNRETVLSSAKELAQSWACHASLTVRRGFLMLRSCMMNFQVIADWSQQNSDIR